MSSISFKVLGIKERLRDGIIANLKGARSFSKNFERSDGLVDIIKIEKINAPSTILKTSNIDRNGPPKNNVIIKVIINKGKIPLSKFKLLLKILKKNNSNIVKNKNNNNNVIDL